MHIYAADQFFGWVLAAKNRCAEHLSSAAFADRQGAQANRAGKAGSDVSSQDSYAQTAALGAATLATLSTHVE